MTTNTHKPAAGEESVELHHIETLLDVVFGVIIALPLLELPKMVGAFFHGFATKSAVAPLLLVAALIFTVFYWLEVRHFIAEQGKFNQAISHKPEDPGEGVPLSRATFVLGGLFMMMLGAAALVFAQDGRVRPFLVANLAFWFCDLAGTFLLNRTYVPFKNAIARVKRDKWLAHRWFWGHISSKFFYFYGAGNAAVFAVALAGDYLTHAAISYRLVIALILVLFTLVRHLFWRSGHYISWLEVHYGNQERRS